jgi:hypothetical protein
MIAIFMAKLEGSREMSCWVLQQTDWRELSHASESPKTEEDLRSQSLDSDE